MKGFRKLTALTIVEGIATWAMFSGQLTGEQWSTLSQWAFAAFVAGNAVEHGPSIATAIKGKIAK